jgi:hypothetical protein
MEHPRDSAASADAGGRPASATPPAVHVDVSGNVGKLAIVGQANRVIISSSHDVSIATQHNPVVLNESLNDIKSRLSELDTVESTSRQRWELALAIQNLIARLRQDAEVGAGHVRPMLPQVASLVTQLERWFPEAVALRVDLVHLYSTVRNYDLAIAEAETLLLSPNRAKTSDDIMLLAVELMNACDYSLAIPLFDMVATATDNGSGLLLPPSGTARALQRATADQYRLLWIPQELGRPEETISNAPGVLSAARILGRRVEAAVLHRLGRAQKDLADASRDRSLLEASLISFDAAMRRMEGTYNFFMPMARYYAEWALDGEGTPALLSETRELSTGLNEGAQAHVHLLDARLSIDAELYFTAVDHADRAIEIWARHPHARGVVDSLSTRALAQFKIGTTAARVAATADLRLARSFAQDRDFDLDKTAKSLLAVCQERLDRAEKRKVLDLMSAFESEHPRLHQRPGKRMLEILCIHG